MSVFNNKFFSDGDFELEAADQQPSSPATGDSSSSGSGSAAEQPGGAPDSGSDGESTPSEDSE